MIKLDLIDVITQKINWAISYYPKSVIKVSPVVASFLSVHLPIEYSEDKYTDKDGIYGTFAATKIVVDEKIPDWEVEVEEID